MGTGLASADFYQLVFVSQIERLGTTDRQGLTCKEMNLDVRATRKLKIRQVIVAAKERKHVKRENSSKTSWSTVWVAGPKFRLFINRMRYLRQAEIERLERTQRYARLREAKAANAARGDGR